MPVHKAVATLAIPTVISQLVTMVYNLADTFFHPVRSGNPVMVAAVPGLPVVLTFSPPWVTLFGLGAAASSPGCWGHPPPGR